jgi:hypothetical protein
MLIQWIALVASEAFDFTRKGRSVPRNLLLALAIIAVGLAGRAAVDKVLALRGGAQEVALWAQLSSVVDIVAAVTMAGVGTGLTVLVSQAASVEARRALLAGSVRVAIVVAAPVTVAVLFAATFFEGARHASGLTGGLLVLGAAFGLASTAPVLVTGYWLGLRAYWRVLALTAVAALAPLAAALLAPLDLLLEALAASLLLPVLVAFAALAYESGSGSIAQRRAFAPYVPAGIAIGIMSPLSMLFARSLVASEMSWEDAGLLQALWRATDWVTALAAGVLSAYFLPRLGAAAGTPRFGAELRAAALATLPLSMLALAVMYVFHGWVFAFLYDETFRLDDATVMFFLAGTAFRIAAAVALNGQYARGQGLAITAGEFLSLPLFAALLWVFSSGLSLERASLLWLVAYVVYAAYCFVALAKFRGVR